jgi:hypothetical protein
MVRKARNGHVCGGRTCGYENVEVCDIFEMCAGGKGGKAIAKALNAQGASSARAQQRRYRTWPPSSVRAVIYSGASVWNKTKESTRGVETLEATRAHWRPTSGASRPGRHGTRRRWRWCGARAVSAVDVRAVETDLREQIEKWRAFLKCQMPIARQMVSRLLDGRIAWTPTARADATLFSGKACWTRS